MDGSLGDGGLGAAALVSTLSLDRAGLEDLLLRGLALLAGWQGGAGHLQEGSDPQPDPTIGLLACLRNMAAGFLRSHPKEKREAIRSSMI